MKLLEIENWCVPFHGCKSIIVINVFVVAFVLLHRLTHGLRGVLSTAKLMKFSAGVDTVHSAAIHGIVDVLPL